MFPEFYTNYVYIMIYCLAITIIIEVLLSFIVGLRKKDLVNVLLVNVLTNPVLNSVHPLFLFNFGKGAQIISLVILEILAFIIEGFIYSKVLLRKKMNGYKLSFICNILSFTIGNLISYLIF